MKEEQYIIIEKFKKIASKKWIKGINNSTNSVGLTFESLLGKNSDSLYFPDYKGIEIKCSQRYSRYPIKLFSLSFDGPNLYEMNRLLESYGISDEIYKERKKLQGQIKINEYERINNNYFKLKIDKANQKITSYHSINDYLYQKNNISDIIKISLKRKTRQNQWMKKNY